ncbi:MAG TPA: hypothetical protein VNL74_03880 [Methylococcus sp.]|nr:hypothetical protein [Methylococcus sp.]
MTAIYWIWSVLLLVIGLVCGLLLAAILDSNFPRPQGCKRRRIEPDEADEHENWLNLTYK